MSLDEAFFIMTNDVECFSFEHNSYEPEVAKRVLKQGLPRLLDLYDRYEIDTTFLFTGNIVEYQPEVIDVVKERGKHEIGCHGFSHEINRGFDVMDMEHQIQDLQMSKRIIESVANKRVVSFRSPAARINANTIISLERCGFLIDSSVCSQRFDGPMSYGYKNKLRWLFAPRMPYHPSKSNPYCIGNSNILEVPVSAFFLPYIGTTMRANPKLTRALWRYLSYESKRTLKPIVFLMHPNECLDINSAISTKRRSPNALQSIFADQMRHRIKLQNLGKVSQRLLEEVIKDAKIKEFPFITLKEFKKRYDRVKRDVYSS